MRKVIRLTESDLHRMIKESVREVLNEGQGLDFAKSTWKDTKDNNYQWDEFKNNFQDDFSKRAKNFINKGDVEGKDTEYYGDTFPEEGYTYGDEDKRINKTLRGKIGRAAGLGAGITAAGFNAYGK